MTTWTQLSLTTQRAIARDNVQCGKCGRTPARRCRSLVTGRDITPHAERLYAAAEWYAQQQIIDRLTAEKSDLERRIAEAADDLALVRSALHENATERTRLTTRLAEVEAELNEARDNIEAARVAGEKLMREHGALQSAYAAALKRIEELTTKPPVTPLPFGIGINEKVNGNFPAHFSLTKLEQDAGAKFTYPHEYFRFPTTGRASDVIAWCEKHLAAGRIPVPTIKMPGDDWTGAAQGKYDAVIDATMDSLQALVEKYRTAGFRHARIVVGIQHEANNDGKPKATFDAMIAHLSPIVRRPGDLELWLNMTGWAQLYGPDNDWRLEDLVTDGIDGIAFNPYLSLGGSSNSFTDMVTAYAEKFGKWAKARGIQWGIWETGLNADAAVMAGFAARTSRWWIDFVAGCKANGATMVIYWNNRVSADKEDWRISTLAPADTHAQMVATVREYALAA